MQIPRTCPLTLGDRMNFLHLTELNPTHNPGKMKVSHQTDAEMMIMMIMILGLPDFGNHSPSDTKACPGRPESLQL